MTAVAGYLFFLRLVYYSGFSLTCLLFRIVTMQDMFGEFALYVHVRAAAVYTP